MHGALQVWHDIEAKSPTREIVPRSFKVRIHIDEVSAMISPPKTQPISEEEPTGPVLLLISGVERNCLAM